MPEGQAIGRGFETAKPLPETADGVGQLTQPGGEC